MAKAIPAAIMAAAADITAIDRNEGADGQVKIWRAAALSAAHFFYVIKSRKGIQKMGIL